MVREIAVRVTCTQTSSETTDIDNMLTMKLKSERRRALRNSDTWPGRRERTNKRDRYGAAGEIEYKPGNVCEQIRETRLHGRGRHSQ